VTLSFVEYDARRVVNVHRHVDGAWFWDRYSAHPYVGCRTGCAFCYQRGGPYLGGRDPAAFDSVIRVKRNAAALLRRELRRKPREVIACGDWQQPAEGRYRLSRAMLEVVRDLGFPLFVVERSPAIVRDLDLLQEIARRAAATVLFSVSSLDPRLKRAFEPRSPGVRRRFAAMAALAAGGVAVGTALMPTIPVAGDDERHLDEVVCATRDHGGRFVLAGGLTLDGPQARLTLDAARRFDPALPDQWRAAAPWTEVARRVRDLCARRGLADRLPRPILPGPRAVNQRIAELLFRRTWELELEGAAAARVWAYRKAAWAVDDWPAPEPREVPGLAAGLQAEIDSWLGQDPEVARLAGAARGQQLTLRLGPR